MAIAVLAECKDLVGCHLSETFKIVSKGLDFRLYPAQIQSRALGRERGSAIGGGGQTG